MLGIFVFGFVYAAIVKLVNCGAGVADEHRGVGGYNKLRPAAFIQLMY